MSAAEPRTRASAASRAIIRLIDIAFSIACLFALAPFALAALAAAALAFGSPAFAARRLGRGGLSFLHVKIRTMREGRSYGRAYLEEARIPPFFKLLRALHIDEYPEFVLVLAGKMSMVGPRPLPGRLIDGCLSKPSADRGEARPGIFGLAQLKLAREGYVSSASQFALDAAWVRRRSPPLYIGIVAATLGPVLRARPSRPGPESPAYRSSLKGFPHR